MTPKEVMLKAALFYHSEGLCVIPVLPRDKRPAANILGGAWEPYQTRRSTKDEINHWWANGFNQTWNIGIVHGEVSENYVTIDIDHDQGILDEIKRNFPGLVSGRIEQSGSGEGFHIPLRVEELPDFGQKKDDTPRGNKTWKTPKGSVNIRARLCQTVAPPSIHPTGNRYRFIQKGGIAYLYTLAQFIDWLGVITPQKKVSRPEVARPKLQAPGEDTLLGAVLAHWQNPLQVFAHFGLTHDVKEERDGQIRLRGNGGLLVTADHQVWNCFEEEFGGSTIEAWAYCTIGTGYDKHKDFRQVLLDMASAAGIDTTRFYSRGDEYKTQPPTGQRFYWTDQPKYKGLWEKMR